MREEPWLLSDALKSVVRQPRDASALQAGRRLADSADLLRTRDAAVGITFRGPLRGLAEGLHPANAGLGDSSKRAMLCS